MSRDRSGVVDATIVKLLLASFTVALATSGFIFAVPFYVLAKLGRTDVVGQVVAVWTVGYIVSCLVAQHLARRTGPQALVVAATVGVGVFIYLFRFSQNVWQMSVIGLGYGLFLGLFWAPLMGWLSGRAEGVVLSRRLGLFNISWSSSIVIAPILAGYLVRHSVEVPFAIMTAIMAAACLVCLVTRPAPVQQGALHAGTDEYAPLEPAFPVAMTERVPPGPAEPGTMMPLSATDATDEAPLMSPHKVRWIRYFGWTGALVGYLVLGVYRFQTPHLAETLHMDKAVFGWVMMSLSLAITAAFFLTAQWTGWHGRTRYIFIPQMVLAGIAVLLTWASTAWAMVPLMLGTGVCTGLLYTSSVFYGSLGAPASKRTNRMAVHEVCLNIGVITGSYFGNLLSQHLGPSQVYPYLAMVVGVAAAAELVLWNVLSLQQVRVRLGQEPRQPGLNPAVGEQQ